MYIRLYVCVCVLSSVGRFRWAIAGFGLATQRAGRSMGRFPKSKSALAPEDVWHLLLPSPALTEAYVRHIILELCSMLIDTEA